MVQSKTKSKTFSRIKKRAISRLSTHYKRRKPKKGACNGCGAPLLGTASGFPFKIKKLSKTQRRPERPFGGVLCSKCARETLKKKARKEND